MDTASIVTHVIADPLLAASAVLAWKVAKRRHPRWGWDCIAFAFSAMVVRRIVGWSADVGLVEADWRTVERALLVLISLLLFVGVWRMDREVA